MTGVQTCALPIFGVGQLGRAQTIAYGIKGRDWLYAGAPNAFEPPLEAEHVNSATTTRGWVYVLSNPAMPGILKIGFSTKDPIVRAAELEGTGVPAPFVVEYDALVFEPRAVEQATHERLSAHRTNKEFFQVTVATAVAAVQATLVQQGKVVLAHTQRGK